LTRNLEPSEILGQVIAVRALPEYRESLFNIVFMGMGEPLDNLENVVSALSAITLPEGLGFSHRKVTVSTSGLLPALRFFGESTEANLAVSLNAADDETRSRLMPINRRYPLAELMASLTAFPLPRRKRITLEYIMLKGVNDRDADARNLIKLLGGASGLRIKLNLIPFNASPGIDFVPSPAERIVTFRELLMNRGISAFVRESRGADIAAACGQLAGQKKISR
jgi:23S rRNA (adenine2503-C2)-methyltransferase